MPPPHRQSTQKLKNTGDLQAWKFLSLYQFHCILLNASSQAQKKRFGQVCSDLYTVATSTEAFSRLSRQYRLARLCYCSRYPHSQKHQHDDDYRTDVIGMRMPILVSLRSEALLRLRLVLMLSFCAAHRFLVTRRLRALQDFTRFSYLKYLVMLTILGRERHTCLP